MLFILNYWVTCDHWIIILMLCSSLLVMHRPPVAFFTRFYRVLIFSDSVQPWVLDHLPILFVDVLFFSFYLWKTTQWHFLGITLFFLLLWYFSLCFVYLFLWYFSLYQLYNFFLCCTMNDQISHPSEITWAVGGVVG